MSWTIWMATAVVIATIYALIKRYETRLSTFNRRFLNGTVVHEANDGFPTV